MDMVISQHPRGYSSYELRKLRGAYVRTLDETRR